MSPQLPSHIIVCTVYIYPMATSMSLVTVCGGFSDCVYGEFSDCVCVGSSVTVYGEFSDCVWGVK